MLIGLLTYITMISQELYDECLRDALAEPKHGFESLPPGWLRRQLMKRGMYIKDKIDALRKEAEEIREKLGAKLQEISDLENSCKHDWSEPKRVYDKDYAHSHYNKKWERFCSLCGKRDWTIREAMQAVPVFDDLSAIKINI